MIGQLIESIIQELQGFVQLYLSMFIENANSAAHVLAKEAAEQKIDLCWSEDISRSISHIIFRELVCS